MIRARSAAVLIFCALLPACFAPPEAAPPLPGPDVTQGIRWFHGSLLSGPMEGTGNPVEKETAVQVKVSFHALRDRREFDLPPLSENTRLIIVSRGGRSIIATPVLTPGSRFDSGASARSIRDQLRQMGSAQCFALDPLLAVVPAGATAVFHMEDRLSSPHPVHVGPFKRKVEIQVSLDRDESMDDLQVGLAMEDLCAMEDRGPDGRIEDGQLVIQHELVCLKKEAMPESGAAVFLIPSPFETSPARTIAVVIEVDLQPEEDHAHGRLLEECLQGLEEAPVPLAAGTRGFTIPDLLEGLRWPPQQRRALVFLAHEVGAPFAGDLCLSAPDSLIAPLAGSIFEAASDPDRGDPPWVMESKAYALTAELMEQQALPLEVEGLLVIHAGELGRHAYLLRQMAETAKSLKAIREILLAQNFQFLDDSSPASRIRAHNWLQQQGWDLPGYDPLAPARERREAMESAAENIFQN